MKYVIFDLDNTLYPKELGLFKLVDQRINDYMRIKLGIGYDLVENLRLKYMDQYGTTLGGLIIHHKVDPDQYLHYVHDIALEELLSTNFELRKLLERIVLDKVIFTNGSFSYAIRVLKILGVDKYFSQIFDIKFMGYLAKPNLWSYKKVLDALGVEGRDCLIVEDLTKNLLPAKKLGMTTVLVGKEDTAGADFIIEDIFGMDRVLGEIGLSH
ncbi:MAG: pyrimidine 5'-nucleotidase [Thermodesulfobacteriota bacterium]